MVRGLYSCAVPITSAVLVGIAVLTVSCKGAFLIADLRVENLSFVEIGMFGMMRTLDPFGPFFDTHKLRDDDCLIGVSSAGDRLLMLAQSRRTPETPYLPPRYDEVDITTLEGKAETRILARVYRMLAFSAELSPDGQMVAFRGHFATPDKSRADYGLHLLKASGEVSTLVATTEAGTPNSIGWSKDGRTIVYDHDGHVLLYNLGSGDSTLLTEGTEPVWSRDGVWIAYRRPDGGAALVHPDGSGRKRILEGVTLGRGLRWSPDSRYLLYTDFTAGWTIHVLEITTGRTARLIVQPTPGYTEAGLRWVRGMYHSAVNRR
ncbi:MAG TPA: hypothetical protein VMH80_25940 [Bryobacteraceae bacterium]|nr:hypothetical protein [Bryobacteraceae bacterium]